MEFLNFLVVILIAFAAFTGLIIATEVLYSLYLLIKNRVMPILGGKGKQQKIKEMMTKDKKTETPTYEELKHENEMLRKDQPTLRNIAAKNRTAAQKRKTLITQKGGNIISFLFNALKTLF